ncbi:Conserved_hypothetical protein [Hexamita inflata]|uniref:Uncharacterized protein n=1 Tax=Hexamita inflata TaxID=28002 RepID=A0AA86PZZ4_9EUKA|nr:Conserved hypothetical protein [Hexamita inflata]CAI9947276.1 Conserved hypothetical protein [Hexamita inflata]
MGRVLTINNQQFSCFLRHQVQFVCNQIFVSDYHMSMVFQKLSNAQRQQCWQNMSILLNKTCQQVKDFYYNSWVRQFSPDLTQFKDELVQLIEETKSQCEEKETARKVCDQLIQRYKHFDFNMKAINQYVRKLILKPQQDIEYRVFV